MSEAPQPTQEASQGETVQVEDLDQFVRYLSGWHTNQVKILEHMLQVPEGTEVVFEGTERKLEGDYRQGYRLGLSLALMEMGKLPFLVEVEPDSTPNPDPAAQNGQEPADAAP